VSHHRAVPAIAVFVLALLLGQAPRVAAQTTEADVYVAQAIIDIDERRYDAALANLKRALELEADRSTGQRTASRSRAQRRWPAWARRGQFRSTA